ncbi:unnamed protein product [Blepharisma stoltei]|uniref:HMG box domain-containing protein n=1 Tax=Blepharisma stoltei TaxID=1481888 RepID=A0AAU9J7E7_9CILI|nr:unnamed protein product [Blepharisma stoltei]
MPLKKAVHEESKTTKSSENESPGNPSNTQKLKKPPSAYILFTKDKRAEVKTANPQIKNKDILSELGKMWNAATEEVKAQYSRLAEAEKEKYQKLLAELGEDTKPGKRKDASDSDNDNKKRKATNQKAKCKSN